MRDRLYFSALDDSDSDRVTVEGVEWSLYHSLLFDPPIVINDTYLFHSRVLAALWSNGKLRLGLHPSKPPADQSSSELVDTMLRKHRLEVATTWKPPIAHDPVSDLVASITEHYRDASWFRSQQSSTIRKWVIAELQGARYAEINVVPWRQAPDRQFASRLREIFALPIDTSFLSPVPGASAEAETFWLATRELRDGAVEAAASSTGLERAKLADELVRRLDPELHRHLVGATRGGALLFAVEALVEQGRNADALRLQCLARIVNDAYQCAHAEAIEARAYFLPGRPAQVVASMGPAIGSRAQVSTESIAMFVALPGLEVLRTVGAKRLWELRDQSENARLFERALNRPEVSLDEASASLIAWTREVSSVCREVAGIHVPLLRLRASLSRGAAPLAFTAGAMRLGSAPPGATAIVTTGATVTATFDYAVSRLARVFGAVKARRVDGHFIPLPVYNDSTPAIQVDSN